MSQILKSLQLPITGSAPSTPPSGFGALYASGSNKLFYKNPSGTEFDLLKPNGFINILYYTGSVIGDGTTRTYPWSKPPGLKYLEVCCVGAGGGGGSGRKGLTNNLSNAGGGGGGGAVVWGFFDANSLSSSYTITTGAGGAGGARQTTNGNNGLAGASGGTSSFGSLVVAAGGGGGPLGSTGNAMGLGGNALDCTPEGLPYAINGCCGGFRNTTPDDTPASTAIIFNPYGAASISERLIGFGGGGGGIGGGRNVNFPNGVPAVRGSNGYQFTTLIINGGSVGNSGSDGGNATPPTDNMITTLLQFTGSTTLYGLGGGGHGGGYGQSLGGNGGNGSNGGLYGAGGGGGGATASTASLSGSGAGGSGSAGLCIVVEFY